MNQWEPGRREAAKRGSGFNPEGVRPDGGGGVIHGNINQYITPKVIPA